MLFIIFVGMENNNLDVKTFWERFSQISKSRNVTQVSLCAELEIDLQQLRNKKSNGAFPTLEQLVKISNYFGVSINYMLTGSTTNEFENSLLSELETYRTKFEKLKEIINDDVSATSLPPSNE